MAKHRYPRSHDHQHTSRKCPLTPTRPGTGASVPPGSPLAPLWGTPVTPNPRPPTPKFGGPACMRPGARGPFAVRPVSGRPAAPGPPARPPNLGCRRVWVRGHGSARGGVPGGTDVPPVPGGRVYGGTCGMDVDVRGIIRRRFLSRASSYKNRRVCGGMFARSVCTPH